MLTIDELYQVLAFSFFTLATHVGCGILVP